MSENQTQDGAIINSIIGVGTKFKGDFDLTGVLRIDGDFVGTIRTKGRVFIGSNGRAECTMHAGIVTIGGIVRGDIYSSEVVTILSTGMVIGTITTPRLIIEDGVVFNGTCKVDKNCTVEIDNITQQKSEHLAMENMNLPNNNHVLNNSINESSDVLSPHIQNPVASMPKL
jgi:cytoskeletal protein CcmA (bactofilin family)